MFEITLSAKVEMTLIEALAVQAAIVAAMPKDANVQDVMLHIQQVGAAPGPAK